MKTSIQTPPLPFLHRLHALLLAAITWALVSHPSVLAGEYDAGLGTLPTTQGWTLYQNGNPPNLTVSGGFLNQGTTEYGGYQAMYRDSETVPDFTGPGSFHLEARLKIGSSTYRDFGWGSRTGYSIHAYDENGRGFIVGIADTGVQLANAGWVWSAGTTALLSYDTTSAFRTYRLVVEGGVGSLYIDGSLALALSLVPSQTSPTQPNAVFFGDWTGGGNSQSQLDYVRYQAVPEPALTVPLTCAGLLASGCLLRRRAFRRET